MKKYNTNPTNKNIINSLSGNIVDRSGELINLINLLDNLEDNFFISIDGAWGSGKTFFVKQLETVLNYYRNINYNETNDVELTETISNNNILNKLQLKNNYKVLYYNAWLYDNHNDPILSLIYGISQQVDINSNKNSCFKSNLISILQTIDFWNINKIANIVSVLQNEDILQNIKTLEEIKVQINEILDDVINECCDKLVIIIDELDRCNPNYAVILLERLKHYFNDDRIIFILSVNKSQLIHTITNCYGSDFDATGYLNKFFDFNVKLAVIDAEKYVQSINLINRNNYFFNKMIFEVLNYMNFSLRDASIYIQQLSEIEKVVNNLSNNYITVCAMFIPLIIAYRINDINKSTLIETGQGKEIIEDMINKIEYFQKFIMRLCATQEKDSNTMLYNAKVEYFKIYDYIFGNKNIRNSWYYGSIELDSEVNSQLMKICNTYKL